MKHRIKHTEKWFKNRVGKFVINRKTKELIKVENVDHARLLFLNQSIGVEYIVVRATINEHNWGELLEEYFTRLSKSKIT